MALRAFLFTAAVICLVCSAPIVVGADRQPNLIVILADDLGAETVGVYGGESYRTPRLDELAGEGVRFAHGHAQPLCTPSRVKIMTGQHNFRNYRHFGYLDPGETTFAHVLRDAGYHTAVIGKWQLFNNRFEDIEGALPADAGFDEYALWQLKVEQRGSRYWEPLIDHDGDLRQYDASVFGPDVLNRAALDYIETRAEAPFFLYYPMVLPHDPFVTTPDMRDEAASDQEKFAAMVAYMDKLVGRVVDKVKELGIAENTVIFFIGDNGTDRDIVSRYRGEDVKGAKGRTLNTGSRVPFLAWGPGAVVPGRVSDSLVNLNDVLPTLAELAGVVLADNVPRDGVSLLPVLRGAGELPRENLFVHFEPRWPTARPGRYAFDRRWKFYEDGRFYDMQADPLERNVLDPGGLGREGLVAYRALQARVLAMPGELDTNTRWVPTVAFILVGLALGIAVIIFLWAARMLRGLPGEPGE